ncbi:MAG TPA: helix-turn-helix domain-containing protein [Solirubrobacter sp.]|nr:helix-turn-helix domain-containing protein [Solirubrobacter sp.]
MSSGTLERLEHGAEVRGERARILEAVSDRLEAVVEAAVDTMRVEIPAYAAAPDAFMEDVRHQVRRHYETKLGCLLAEQEVTLDDLSFARGAAMRRARAGLALEDFINAFRVGQQVFWEAVLECADGSALGREAALTLATPLMRYCDFASTHAGHAYAEFLQHAVADADRERRDLLEHLLAGEMPPRGPLCAAVAAYGLGADARMLVVVAVPASPEGDAGAAGAALARAALGETRTLVVGRQGEVVAVPALGPGCDAVEMCARVERACADGLPLALGVSTVAAGVAELPRAYVEARAALECVGESGGVAALPRMSAFRYLTLSAPDTARRLVDPALRGFLAEDRARGGVLRDTIRALAAADLRINVAAERLQVHPNTATYRLRRILELTGRNPRRVDDLLELLTAIALEECP